MSHMSHTPGPWAVEQDLVNNGDIDVHAAEMLPIASIAVREDQLDIGGLPREVALANARLIAAAPDLLEACKDVVKYFDDIQQYQHRLLVLNQTLETASDNWDEATLIAPLDIGPIQAAIAKAEGQ